MKKILSLCLAFVLALPLAIAQAAEIDEHPTLVVMPFKLKAPVRWDGFTEYAGAAEDKLVGVLLDTGRFEVRAQDDLAAVVGAQSEQQSGLETAGRGAALGDIKGADFLVVGSLTSLTAKTESGSVANEYNEGVSGKRYKVSATVMLRVVDAKTGSIILFGRGKGNSDSSSVTVAANGVKVSIGTDEVSQEQCANAAEKAAYDAVHGSQGILAQLDGKMKKRGKL